MPSLAASSASNKSLLIGILPPKFLTLKSYASFQPATAPGTVKADKGPREGIELKF